MIHSLDKSSGNVGREELYRLRRVVQLDSFELIANSRNKLLPKTAKNKGMEVRKHNVPLSNSKVALQKQICDKRFLRTMPETPRSTETHLGSGRENPHFRCFPKSRDFPALRNRLSNDSFKSSSFALKPTASSPHSVQIFAPREEAKGRYVQAECEAGSVFLQGRLCSENSDKWQIITELSDYEAVEDDCEQLNIEEISEGITYGTGGVGIKSPSHKHSTSRHKASLLRMNSGISHSPYMMSPQGHIKELFVKEFGVLQQEVVDQDERLKWRSRMNIKELVTQKDEGKALSNLRLTPKQSSQDAVQCNPNSNTARYLKRKHALLKLCEKAKTDIVTDSKSPIEMEEAINSKNVKVCLTH
eukprot:TRINITY_DN5703_c0_g2_i8.p1 TRINITY_DN5703_c0_g2~~TRINITY_DN5703_c0_g2_i8.p1  ORF type:complete len:359 (-),score=71.51 TRINITY_DN5703_c0_g2_i8:165-1241(-)